jgi:hypothetical protein
MSNDAQSEADEIKQALTAIADEHYSGQVEELCAAIDRRDPELLDVLPEFALNVPTSFIRAAIKEFLRADRQEDEREL